MSEFANETEQAEAIQNLLDKGRTNGREDPYGGKRRWRRYRLGTPLEVSFDPQVCGGSWRVITHNVSGGGLGFWSSHAFTRGERIFVREYMENGSAVWLTGQVSYSVLGLNGYLTGVAFECPTAPDFLRSSMPTVAHRTGHQKRAQRPFSSLPLSIRTYAGLLCAGGGILAVGTALLLADYAPAGLGRGQLVIIQMAAALAVGFVAGVLGVWVEARAIRAIREAIDRLSAGTPCTTRLPAAVTLDVARIRRSLLDLGVRWAEYAEAERSQRQKLEEINQIKTNVLSVVSHDLRTPLTSIQLYSEMLSEDIENLSPDEQRTFLNTISEECLRLTRLVSDLIEVQRSESQNVEWAMEPTDLAETVRSVARTFAPITSQQQVALAVECPETLPPVAANVDKMTQALSNLLSNALKHSEPNGTVRLAVEAGGDEVRLSVADNGPGIPRDKWDVIFDRFSQLPSPHLHGVRGVGLGLYIVRNIVERHGGCVWVDSALGKGSEFTLVLPAGEQIRAAAPSTDNLERAGRVLVCDADPSTVARLSQALREQGFEVRQAHSGNRLLDHLSESIPDVVITDVALPDMRADELLQRLAERKPWTFRLVLHSMTGADDELRAFGVDVFLERPVTRDELIRAACVAMHKQAGGGPVMVLLNGYGMDVDLLSRCLAGEGCMPLVASNVSEAGVFCHVYPVDGVVVQTGPEGVYSKILPALREEVGPGTRVCALTDALSDWECQKHSKGDLVYVRQVSGRTEALAESLAALCGQAPMEPVT